MTQKLQKSGSPKPPRIISKTLNKDFADSKIIEFSFFGTLGPLKPHPELHIDYPTD